jgi:hypothetical protein
MNRDGRSPNLAGACAVFCAIPRPEARSMVAARHSSTGGSRPWVTAGITGAAHRVAADAS